MTRELTDEQICAAEAAYDEVIRKEGCRSPYMNTRAFRAAFAAASVDTRPKAGDALAAPLAGGAVPNDSEADAQ